MREIVEPHGGILKPLLVSDVEHAKALHEEAKSLQHINLFSMEISDLIMMASGAFSSQRHPGVAKLYKQDEYRLGGSVVVLSEGEYPSQYGEYARPQETRTKLSGEVLVSSVQVSQEGAVRFV